MSLIDTFLIVLGVAVGLITCIHYWVERWFRRRPKVHGMMGGLLYLGDYEPPLEDRGGLIMFHLGSNNNRACQIWYDQMKAGLCFRMTLTERTWLLR